MKVGTLHERAMMKSIERHRNRLPHSAPPRAGLASAKFPRHVRAIAMARHCCLKNKQFANNCFQRTVKMLRILPSAEGPRCASQKGLLR
jgi:hypothetical protein